MLKNRKIIRNFSYLKKYYLKIISDLKNFFGDWLTSLFWRTFGCFFCAWKNSRIRSPRRCHHDLGHRRRRASSGVYRSSLLGLATDFGQCRSPGILSGNGVSAVHRAVWDFWQLHRTKFWFHWVWFGFFTIRIMVGRTPSSFQYLFCSFSLYCSFANWSSVSIPKGISNP